MKNLQDQQTELFNKYGVFFAFSDKQYNEAAIEGIKYTSLGGGMIAPYDNAKAVMTELNDLHEKNRQDDLKENGKKKIIHRELANYETQITGDISDTVEALECYGITRDEVAAEYKEYFDYCVANDYF